ncbi:MAG: NADPH-dependent oxidoreductase [Muribaculaceae bacterium]|nr:NADPH-dependent oxidoreductase [Muribaculaceae bacterium]
MNNKDYFSTRRSIRRYDASRNVDRQMLMDLLGRAVHAPNTGNMQTYSVILTTDPEVIASLAPAHYNQPAISGAKAVATFCLDFNRFNRWCALGGAQPGLDNLQGFTWGVIDTSIVAQQFCTLAEMEGLGTCYLGTTTYNAGMIAETLGLPREVVPVITVTLGYPAEDPSVQPRLPLEAVVHVDRYKDPSDDDIRRFYADEEALEENRRFVAENGKENLAQVFAEVRYPRESNERFSRVYREFLKNQGIEL